MEFNEITDYIENLYKNYNMIKQHEFIQESGLKEFCPVIETETARLLRLLLRLKTPNKVLEIGTSIGYSTASIAMVLKEWKGKIITIELDPYIAQQARKNFERWGITEIVDIRIGDAMELLPDLKEKFDFIFFDPFNDVYPLLLPYCIQLMNKGGILIADDTLSPIFKNASYNSPLHKYNQIISKLPDFESTILAVGDGVTIAVKK